MTFAPVYWLIFWREKSYVGGLHQDQGLDAVRSWLRPLLLPYVLESYRTVRGEYGLPPSDGPLPARRSTPLSPLSSNTYMGASRPTWFSPPPAQYSANVGHLALFNQCLQQVSKGVEWVYTGSDGEGSKTTPIWVSSTPRVHFFGHTSERSFLGRAGHGKWGLRWLWTREHEESRKE